MPTAASHSRSRSTPRDGSYGALVANKPITWERLKEFQDTTLKCIAARLVPTVDQVQFDGDAVRRQSATRTSGIGDSGSGGAAVYAPRL